MLHVVTVRTEGMRYAHNHIVADGWWNAFCGVAVPLSVREMWGDPRNPYVDKGNVTCPECGSEFHNGRREGYREGGGSEDVSGLSGADSEQ